MSKNAKLCVYFLCLAVLVLSLVSPVLAARYACIPVGEFFPMSVNNAGQIVGSTVYGFYPSDGYATAYIWQDGTLSEIGSGEAWAVNQTGRVAGFCRADFGYEGYAWTWPNNSFEGSDGIIEAYDINDQGQVLCMQTDYTDWTLGVWTNGQFVTVCDATELGETTVGYIGAINNKGWVVSQSSSVFVWKDGVRTTIGTVGSRAHDISDAGVVVGSAGGHACMWDGVAQTDLGALAGDGPSDAWCLNNACQVVGYSEGSPMRAFLWENGVMADLNSLIPQDWPTPPLVRAYGINDLGWIVGIAGQGFPSAGYLLVPNKVGEFKRFGDGGPVDLRDKAVTAAFTDVLYIGDVERGSGIRVAKTNHGAIVGNKVNVKGTMRTGAGGERYVEATTVIVTGSAAAKPMGMTNGALLCAGWNYNSTTGSGQAGATGGVGANTIGMLVRTSGRVVQSDQESNPPEFHIDDGTARTHGASGYIGVKASGSGIVCPPEESFVTVTGICSLDAQNAPVLLVRNQDDIISR